MGLDRTIDITSAQRKTLLALLERYLPNTETWVYGSRAKWTSRPQSDLDLVVFATPEQERRVSDLREAFEESNLPFRVDLFVWDSVPEQFHKQIEAKHVVLAEREERDVADGWIDATIDDIAASSRNALVGGPFGSNLVSRDYVSEGVPVIRGQNMGTRWVTGDFVFVTPQKAESLEANLARSGDIVLTQRGTLGQVSIVPSTSFGRYLVSQSQMKVTVNREIADPLFFYYVLSSAEQQDYVRQNAIQTGVPHTNLGILRSTPVPVPPLKEQRAISHILGTLDDKIELNRRMNETLEAMARALFKSWFVDFDPVRAKAALKRHAAAHAPLEEESAYITPPLRGSRQGKDEVRGRAGGGTNRWGDIKRQYTQQTLQNAKTLRQTQTNAEDLLWHYLRDKQLDGHNFRRHQPIGPYIADFACMSQKLLIELDGGGHTERKAHDRERDEFLRQRGYRVLRFWNNEVFENCLGVLERVYEALTSSPPRQPIPVGLAAVTPPQGGSDLMDDWTLERARAYLDGMGKEIAALFPDSFVDSELGEIPEGWGVGCLADIAVSPRRGVDPTDLRDETPYMGLEHMPRHSIALTEWGNAEKVTSNKAIFEKGEILFGKLRPYFQKVGIAPVTGVGSTDIVVIAPTTAEWSAFVLACVSSAEFVAYTDQTSTGTKMPRTSWKVMSRYPLCLPGELVAQAFQNVVAPLMDRIVANIHGSRTLAALRDTLLPKLISGRLCVKEAEKFIGRIV